MTQIKWNQISWNCIQTLQLKLVKIYAQKNYWFDCQITDKIANKVKKISLKLERRLLNNVSTFSFSEAIESRFAQKSSETHKLVHHSVRENSRKKAFHFSGDSSILNIFSFTCSICLCIQIVLFFTWLCCCVQRSTVFVLTRRISFQQWISTRLSFIYFLSSFCCSFAVFAVPCFLKFWFFIHKPWRYFKVLFTSHFMINCMYGFMCCFHSNPMFQCLIHPVAGKRSATTVTFDVLCIVHEIFAWLSIFDYKIHARSSTEWAENDCGWILSMLAWTQTRFLL